jgi:glycosyltransferase involved in cell wall biosynthesis
MASTPLLTIFSLCYNTGTYVIEGLESFLQCNFDNYQLIVIDDCSSDDSAQKVSLWLQKNINPDKYIFIRHVTNIGICASFNEVLINAEGKYFTGICDDKWEPDRLDDLVFFQKDPDLGLLFTNARIIDSNSLFTGNIFGNAQYLNWIHANDKYLPELFKGNFILPVSCIYNTELVRSLGGFDEELSFEDWDMFIRIAKSGARIMYVDRFAVQYRQHSSSFWQSRSKPIFISLVRLFKKHMLFKESDSFVTYVEHFSILPFKRRLQYLFWLTINENWKITAVVSLIFINAPSRLRYLVYKFLFQPKHNAWNISLS